MSGSVTRQLKKACKRRERAMPEIVVRYIETTVGDVTKRSMLPDEAALVRQRDESKAMLKEFPKNSKEYSQHQEIIKSLDTNIARLQPMITQAKADGRLKEDRYRYHPYSCDERIRALREAAEWVDGEKRVDELIFKREIVDACIENLQEIHGPGKTAGDLPAKLCDRLYGPIAFASEATEDQIDFFVLSQATMRQTEPSNKG